MKSLTILYLMIIPTLKTALLLNNSKELSNNYHKLLSEQNQMHERVPIGYIKNIKLNNPEILIDTFNHLFGDRTFIFCTEKQASINFLDEINSVAVIASNIDIALNSCDQSLMFITSDFSVVHDLYIFLESIERIKIINEYQILNIQIKEELLRTLLIIEEIVEAKSTQQDMMIYKIILDCTPKTIDLSYILKKNYKYKINNQINYFKNL